MAIVDWAYYSATYLGQGAQESEFPALEARAEDVIEAMTRWAATADTIANLPAITRTLVKKAICAQVDFFGINGLDSLAVDTSKGFTVGKVTIQASAAARASGKMADSIAPLALMYLEQSGLMGPQVETGPDMPRLGGWY